MPFILCVCVCVRICVLFSLFLLHVVYFFSPFPHLLFSFSLVYLALHGWRRNASVLTREYVSMRDTEGVGTEKDLHMIHWRHLFSVLLWRLIVTELAMLCPFLCLWISCICVYACLRACVGWDVSVCFPAIIVLWIALICKLRSLCFSGGSIVFSCAMLVLLNVLLKLRPPPSTRTKNI